MKEREHEHEWSNAEVLRSVEVIPVIKVEFGQGRGCCELSTFRIVTRYQHLDGTFIHQFDPAPPEPKA